MSEFVEVTEFDDTERLPNGRLAHIKDHNLVRSNKTEYDGGPEEVFIECILIAGDRVSRTWCRNNCLEWDQAECSRQCEYMVNFVNRRFPDVLNRFIVTTYVHATQLQLTRRFTVKPNSEDDADNEIFVEVVYTTQCERMDHSHVTINEVTL